MSEEMKELQTNEVTETMADYEDHFDDANPWNRVQDYMDKKTVLPVKIEGVVNGGVIVMVEGLRGFVPRSPSIPFLYRESGRLSSQGYRSAGD